jgi:hypothetical protein
LFRETGVVVGKVGKGRIRGGEEGGGGGGRGRGRRWGRRKLSVLLPEFLQAGNYGYLERKKNHSSKTNGC